MFISIIVSEDLYSHCVVALSLCRYVGFPLEMKSYIFIRHIGTRTKQLYRWSLLNSLILRASRQHYSVVSLASMGIEVGRHSARIIADDHILQ